MRVMFIYTDLGISVGYSCGIGVLSAYLKQHGHQTRLIHISDELDYPLDLERVLQDVRAYDPGLIAFSPVTNQWDCVKEIVNYLRCFLDTPIIMGGHHADVVPIEVIREPAVDYVCKGEGERPLLTLVNGLEAGLPTDGIQNIICKRSADPAAVCVENAPVAQEARVKVEAIPSPAGEGNGEADDIIDNKMGRWIQNLDELPFEDREIFDYERIVEIRCGWAEVIVSRGCPYSCAYCFNRRFVTRYRNDTAGTEEAVTARDFLRRRSPETIIAMLKDVKRRYPRIKYLTFVDDAFAINWRQLAELVPLYVKEIGLPFACTSYPLAFNEKIAALLKEMGCKVVKMGVESGSERIRKQLLSRNVSDEVLFRCFQLARNYGLKPQAYAMIGLPNEARANMLETIRLCARLRPYIVLSSTFMPYPGTELHDFCVKHDLIDPSRWKDIRSFRGGSVLKETTFTHLDIEKLRVLFKPYLNVFLENECSDDYSRLIEEMEAMPAEDWFSGKAEGICRQRDAELDTKWRAREVDHYVAKTYVYMFWAGEYDYDVS